MTEQKDLKELIREVLLAVHPVGSLFFTSDDRNPDVILFGGGYSKWKRIEGRFIYGASENRPIGQTGGEESHQLTTEEIPAHSHSMSTTGNHSHTFQRNKGTDDNNFSGHIANRVAANDTGDDASHDNVTTSTSGNHSHTVNNTGGSQAHNNLPPFAVYAIWERIE